MNEPREPDEEPVGEGRTPPPEEERRGLREIARRASLLGDAELEAQCTLEFFTAGGPGGQHRNKTESGVRLLHHPTGLRAAATERRSQAQNRETALRRLRAKLAAASTVRLPRRPTVPGRGARERRLAEKRRQGERKQMRRPPED